MASVSDRVEITSEGGPLNNKGLGYSFNVSSGGRIVANVKYATQERAEEARVAMEKLIADAEIIGYGR